MKGTQSFDSDQTRDVIVFRVNNNSSSHPDNRKNNFLVLSEKPSYGINESFSLHKKNLLLTLVRQRQNFG